jgi:hypothetical protein
VHVQRAPAPVGQDQRADELAVGGRAQLVTDRVALGDVDDRDRTRTTGGGGAPQLAAELVEEPVLGEQPRAQVVRQGLARHRRTLQLGLHPSQHLLGAEGLAEVVVRAERQAVDGVLRVGARGEHDHGQAAGAGAGAQLTDQLEAVHPGHLDVADDEVRELLADAHEGLAACARPTHEQPGGLQRGREQRADHLVVLDHQDAARRLDRLPDRLPDGQAPRRGPRRGPRRAVSSSLAPPSDRRVTPPYVAKPCHGWPSVSGTSARTGRTGATDGGRWHRSRRRAVTRGHARRTSVRHEVTVGASSPSG